MNLREISLIYIYSDFTFGMTHVVQIIFAAVDPDAVSKSATYIIAKIKTDADDRWKNESL